MCRIPSVSIRPLLDTRRAMDIAILIGTMKGAFVLRNTKEDRASWRLEGPSFKGWKVTAAGRSTDGRFVAATSSFVYGPMLHVSGDLQRWEQVNTGPRYDAPRKLEQIWTLATTQSGMYAGVSEAGLFHATDPAGQWEPVEGLNEHRTRDAWQPGLGGLCAHVVLSNPNNPRQLWCGISAVGVFRSDDGGQTWHPKNRGVASAIEDKVEKDIGSCVHGLVLDPARDGVLYRQDHLGMYRSTDGADSWRKIESGLPSGFGFPIVVDPHTGMLLVYPLESDEFRLPAGGRMRVYRSADGGAEWSGVTRGLPQEDAWTTVLRGAMDVDSLSPCGVYFGTTSGTVHVSADAGASWRGMGCLLPRILCVKAFVL